MRTEGSNKGKGYIDSFADFLAKRAPFIRSSVPAQAAFIASLPAWPALMGRNSTYLTNAYFCAVYVTLTSLNYVGRNAEKQGLEARQKLLTDLQDTLKEQKISLSAKESSSLADYAFGLQNKLKANNYKTAGVALQVPSSFLGIANSLNIFFQQSSALYNQAINYAVIAGCALATASYYTGYFSAQKMSEEQKTRLEDLTTSLKNKLTNLEENADLAALLDGLSKNIIADYKADHKKIGDLGGIMLFVNATLIPAAVSFRELSAVSPNSNVQTALIAATIMYSVVINGNNIFNNILRSSDSYENLQKMFASFEKFSAAAPIKESYQNDMIADFVLKAGALLPQLTAVGTNIGFRSANLAEHQFTARENNDLINTIAVSTLVATAIYGYIYMSHAHRLAKSSEAFADNRVELVSEGVELSEQQREDATLDEHITDAPTEIRNVGKRDIENHGGVVGNRQFSFSDRIASTRNFTRTTSGCVIS